MLADEPIEVTFTNAPEYLVVRIQQTLVMKYRDLCGLYEIGVRIK